MYFLKSSLASLDMETSISIMIPPVPFHVLCFAECEKNGFNRQVNMARQFRGDCSNFQLVRLLVGSAQYTFSNIYSMYQKKVYTFQKCILFFWYTLYSVNRHWTISLCCRLTYHERESLKRKTKQTWLWQPCMKGLPFSMMMWHNYCKLM